jgi:DNA-binding GntR family transcriptional regulator
MSRVELRDLAIHYVAIAATAAELAADAVDAEDADSLAQLLGAGSDTRFSSRVSDFLLELAALSQSARLTREYLRLHTDFGSLLGLAHADPDFDNAMIDLCHRIADAILAADPSSARRLIHDYVRSGVTWLIAEHTRLQDTAETSFLKKDAQASTRRRA